MLVYFAVAFASFAATYGYVFVSLARGLEARRPARRRLAVTCVLVVTLVPTALVVTLRAPASAAPWSVPLAHAAFFVEGLSLLLLLTLLARDAGWQVARLIRPGTAHDAARRRVLLGGLNALALGVAGGAAGIGYAVALAPPAVERVRVRVISPSLAPSWTLKIAQISDLHAGPTIRRAYVDEVVACVQALAADVIVITGDLVDGFVEQLEDVIAPLGSLRARHGVFFVTGNHEHFYRSDEWVSALRRMGLVVLTNAHEVLEHDGARVVVAGVVDPSGAPEQTDRASVVGQAFANAPPADVRVLLAHRPSDIDAARELDVDLQLSGHLHGGQFFPMTLLVRALSPYVAGLYRRGRTWLYVNRGAGYWGPPNRLGARHEVTLLDVTGGP